MNDLFPVYDAYLDSETIGIQHYSYVLEPAIEAEFEAHLSSEKLVEQLYSITDYKYLTGPLLIPNQKILRHGDDGYFYIKYSPEVIKELRDRMFENGFQNEVNIEHNTEKKAGSTLVQSWLAEEEYKGLPAGTQWITVKPKFKITDEFLSHFKGFSIGAKIKIKNTNKMEVKQGIIVSKLKDGTPIVWDDETFEVWTEADMVYLPTGEYELEDGTILKVIDGFIQKEEVEAEMPMDDSMKKEMEAMQAKIENLLFKVNEFDNILNTLNKELEIRQAKVTELEGKIIEMNQEIVKQAETIKVIGAAPKVEEKEKPVTKPSSVHEIAHSKMMAVLENRNKNKNK